MNEKYFEILQNNYLSYLAGLIREKGVECKDTFESIIENLSALSVVKESYGKKVTYLPLYIKEIVAKIISNECHWEFLTENGTDYCRVEALFFWKASDEKPAGRGLVRRSLSAIDSCDFRSESERRDSLEATVRGAAKTRALHDAGIGMEYYQDCVEEEEEETEATETSIPKPVPQEEKKRKRAEKKTQTEPAKETVPEPETISSSVKLPKPVIEQPEEAKPDPVEELPKVTEPLTLDEAFSRVAGLGQCKGYTFKEIYEKQPRNLVWLYNSGDPEKEALKIIIESDERLASFLK